ncbi:4-alpha-glucanotransferase [Rhodococcus pyridinivorans]|uniref:4-alpha-glucanotransferase n=1 Tax=Rhodococcus pyridinivorans TaxID=103816 RepID=UPI0020C65FFE|nr:4-alpha-glucanotransferase [Rhodococcus pyridinivorans]UTM38641.1 4-alpha-glucanotransferase [Rhodococcus pyridinivorans]
MTSSAKLRELAGKHGITTTYTGWGGRDHDVSDETLRRVLAALDVPAGTDDEVVASLADFDDRPWRCMLPPALVVVEGDDRAFPVHVPHGDPVSVWVVAEDGAEVDVEQLDVWVDPRTVDGRLVGRATFAVPRLSLGWHVVHARSNDIETTAVLVVTPRRLSTADRLLEKKRWGLAAQIYSVRSRRSWGIGDFADLADLAAIAAGYGGDFVLINPVHAAEPVPPHEPSPYLPSSRRFVDPLYLRIEDIPEVAYLPAKHRKELDEHAQRAAKANRKARRLDRDATFRAKLDVLERVYRVPLGPARRARYEAFCAEGGQALDDFALWCALYEKFGDRADRWASRAPSPDDPKVTRLRERLASRIDFHRRLQWLCDEQLANAQTASLAAGSDIGIVHDLAVGVGPHGADAWTLGDALASGVTVGAPADDFNRNGQNWNQPPWRPDRLAELGYIPFRDVVRSALRHAGGVRADHILGLFRTWWVPEGMSPADGAYVRSDHEALVGILALEAYRAGAVVVGEDLGVFEEWVQEYLAERGIAGTSILWFERDEDSPRGPETYRTLCLTSVTTHDLAPTAGYLAGDHIRLRSELGLLEGDLDAELTDAAAERDSVLALAVERGLLDEGETDVDRQVEALHRLIAASPSALLGVSLADVTGERRSQNQPGTVDEYPNWRVPLADARGKVVLVEDLVDHDGFARLARAVSGDTSPVE